MTKANKRLIKIILYILEKKYPVPLHRLCNEAGIRINSARKDIPQIKEFLKENGVLLVAKPKIGLRVEGPYEKIENLKDKIKQIEDNLLDKKSKIWYIAGVYLSRRKLPTIEELCGILNVARPTAFNYVSEVKKWLSQKGIKLIGKPGVGYHIEGKEVNVRDAFIEAITKFFGFEFQSVSSEFVLGRISYNLNRFFEDVNLFVIKGFVEDIQTLIRGRITDEYVLKITAAIALSIKRIKEGHKISFESRKINEILCNRIAQFLKNNIYSLEEQFQIKFTDDEIAYLSLKIIESKTQEVASSNSMVASTKFRKISEEIVSLQVELLGLWPNKEDDLVDVLAKHIESAAIKIRVGIKIKNPLLGIVKKEYPIVYSVAERASKIIERRLFIRVSKEEIGYIAMHLAASLEKLKKQRKQKIVVICPLGIATSKLLCEELLNEIPEAEIVQVGSIRDIEEGKIQKGADLIISTVPLYGVKLPFVVVSPILRIEDKKIIRDMLKKRESVSHNESYQSILNSTLILPKMDVSSSSEVIKLLGNTLIKEGYAKNGMAESVLLHERKFPTGISTKIPIAIPHTELGFTIRKGFAIAIVKNPVEFFRMGDPEKTIKVNIVVLPVLDREDGRKDFYKIMQRLSDYKVSNKLLRCYYPEEVKKILSDNNSSLVKKIPQLSSNL